MLVFTTVFTTFGCVNTVVGNEIPGDGLTYTVRGPISIFGDGDFNAGNGVTPGGDGSQGNPYAIEGWEIDAATTHAIEIINTDVNFTIKDCLLDAHGYDHGIYILNSGNAIIENCTVKEEINLQNSPNVQLIKNTIECYGGAVYVNSPDTMLVNNTITTTTNTTSYGAVQIVQDNCTLIENDLTSISHSGAYSTSTNTTFWNNTFNDCGVLVQDLDTLTLTQNNTVNGQPIYFYDTNAGLVMDNVPVGQLIMKDCTDFTISNLHISGAGIGVLSRDCTNGTLSDIVCSDGFRGEQSRTMTSAFPSLSRTAA
jgi:hypothetical protein